MSRRKPELQAIDLNAWPTVAYTELDEGSRRKFEERRQAVLRYVAGHRGIDPRQSPATVPLAGTCAIGSSRWASFRL
jgi:hypothetical protein